MRWLATVFLDCLNPNPVEFTQLGWLSRQRLNLSAFANFCCSAAALRLLLWLVVWQLAAFMLSWTFDFGLRAQTWLVWSAALWVWPCLLGLRRRELESLLAARDTQNLRQQQ